MCFPYTVLALQLSFRIYPEVRNTVNGVTGPFAPFVTAMVHHAVITPTAVTVDLGVNGYDMLVDGL